MKLYVEPGGDKHIPLAKRVAGNLEKMRVKLNLPAMSRRFSPDTDTSVTVQSTPFSLLVRIHHIPAGNMLFCKRVGDNATVFAYDYMAKVLTQLGSIPVGSGPLGLLPFHNLRSHLVSPSTSDGYDTSVHLGPDVTFEDDEEPILLAYRVDKTNGREYAVAMDGQNPVLYARTPGTAFRKAAIYPARTAPEGQTFKWAIQDGDDPRVFQISGGVVYLAGYWVGADLWNLFNGYEFFGYDPTGESAPIYQWFSELGFASGAQFEANGISWNGTNGPFREPVVEFGTLLDDRFGSDGRGHCEMILQADYVEGIEGEDISLSARFVNANTSDTIPPVVVDFSEHLSAADTFEYHYWSTGTPEGVEERAASGRWAALISGSSGKWVLHDYPGFTRQTIGGGGYNFHTVSSSGNFVFVVGTVAGVEQGLMLDTLTGEVTDHPLVIGFESGCFIPAQSATANQITLLSTVADIDTVIEDPSQGEVRPTNTSRGVWGDGLNWKIVTDAPFLARGLLWVDDCWTWSADEVVAEAGGIVEIDGVEYPFLEAPYRIGSTPDNHTLFGTFSSDEDTLITVEPVGVKAIEGIDLLTTFDHPGISVLFGPIGFPDNTFKCVDCNIPVVWEGPGLFDPGHYEATGEKIAPTNIYATATIGEASGCSYTVEATDDCGRIAESEEIELEQPPLFITGPDAPIVGSVYTASGGLPPYRYTFDGGTIDGEGEVLTIDDCGGAGEEAGMGEVTATDLCDTEASIDVRLPGGHWEEQDPTECTDPRPTCAGFYDDTLQVTEIVGNTKTTYYYCAHRISSPFGAPCGGFPCDCCEFCRPFEINPLFTDTTFYKRIFHMYTANYLWECPP